MAGDVQQVEAELVKVSARIEKLEAKLEAPPADATPDDKQFWQQDVLALREEKKLLLQRLPPAQGQAVAPIGYSWEATLPGRKKRPCHRLHKDRPSLDSVHTVVFNQLTAEEQARGFVLYWKRNAGTSGSNPAEARGADMLVTDDDVLDMAYAATSPLDDGVVHVHLRVALNDPAAFTTYTTIQAAMQVLLLEDYEDNARPILVKGLIERFDLKANAELQLPDWCQQFLDPESKTAWTVSKIVERAVESIGFVLCTAARGSSEATKRLYVDVIVKAAMLIAMSVCGLAQHELLMELEVSLKGHTAAGDLDYLLVLVNERLAVLEAKADSIAEERYVGQLLAQLSAVRDQAPVPDVDDIEQSTDKSNAATTAGSNHKRKRDVHGVLTNGTQWGIYVYSPGNATVKFELLRLSIDMLEGPNILRGEVQVILSVLVSVLHAKIEASKQDRAAKKTRK